MDHAKLSADLHDDATALEVLASALGSTPGGVEVGDLVGRISSRVRASAEILNPGHGPEVQPSEVFAEIVRIGGET